MLTVQKPAEVLQAQVALYADTLPHLESHYRRSELIIRSLGETAACQPLPVFASYSAKNTRNVTDINRNSVTVYRTGDEIPLFDKAEYSTSVLNPENRALTPALAELIAGYTEYEVEVVESGILGLTIDEAKRHSNYLSHGGSEIAFKFIHTKPDGTDKAMVARYGQLQKLDSAATILSINVGKANGRAITFAAGKGIAGLEQGVAVSYNPPFVVSEFAPGKNLYSLSPTERASIPVEHWDKLMATVAKASAANISLDSNNDNFIYNPNTGFTILDYRIANRSKSKEEIAATNTNFIIELRQRVLSDEAITRN